MDKIISYPGEGVSEEEWARIFPAAEPEFFCENCGWQGNKALTERAGLLPWHECPKCRWSVKQKITVGEQREPGGNTT